MINIQKLSKEYVKNQIVLSDITLEIKEGEISYTNAIVI